MESDTHLLYFTKLSGKSQDFYFLVGIYLNTLVDANPTLTNEENNYYTRLKAIFGNALSQVVLENAKCLVESVNNAAPHK